MTLSRPLIVLPLFAIGLAFVANHASSRADTPLATMAPAQIRSADIVVSGTVAEDPEISVLESYPAIYVYRFKLRATTALKGSLPADAWMSFSHRGENHQPIRKGDRWLLALRKLDQNLEKRQSLISVLDRVPDSAAARAAARQEIAKLGPLGANVTMTIEQIAPKTPIKWRNPYGDGRFRVVIENRGQRIRLPAVVAFNNDGSKVVRPASVVPANSTQTFEVDALELPIANPPGGARLWITVQMGDKSVSSFFYYSYDVHGPMQEQKSRKRTK